MAITTEIVNFKELNVLGIPCKGLTNMGDKVGNAVKELMKYVQEIKTFKGKPWFGVFQPCPEEVENEELIYFVCVEIEEALEQGSYPKELQQITIPEQRYMVIHKEKNDSIKEVYGKLNNLLVERNELQNSESHCYILEFPVDESWESVQVFVPIE
ncbi:GyrI-like domain-containing protein [Paenibacillus senegalensis]|uniref:GyrI-like domain-containing protein n=1 Tax=Paenibacillus senegalensis TaxID=1465766 RepID=UPI0002881DBC|nr:GyrI-like domain-containing protein [Paenibacillus senegalensis]